MTVRRVLAGVCGWALVLTAGPGVLWLTLHRLGQ